MVTCIIIFSRTQLQDFLPSQTEDPEYAELQKILDNDEEEEMSDSDGDQGGGFYYLLSRVGIGGTDYYWGGVEVVLVIYSSYIHRIIRCFY